MDTQLKTEIIDAINFIRNTKRTSPRKGLIFNYLSNNGVSCEDDEFTNIFDTLLNDNIIYYEDGTKGSINVNDTNLSMDDDKDEIKDDYLVVDEFFNDDYFEDKLAEFKHEFKDHFQKELTKYEIKFNNKLNNLKEYISKKEKDTLLIRKLKEENITLKDELRKRDDTIAVLLNERSNSNNYVNFNKQTSFEEEYITPRKSFKSPQYKRKIDEVITKNRYEGLSHDSENEYHSRES